MGNSVGGSVRLGSDARRATILRCAIGGLACHAGEHGLVVQDAPVTIRGGELGQLKVVGSGFQTALQIIETDGGQEIERGGRGFGYVVVGGSSIAAKGEE